MKIGILGAGFAGTLAAIVLQKLGHSTLIIDPGKHPRFTIGESSTPIADQVLATLCRRFQLDELLPLATYATASQPGSPFRVGPKRGFTYLAHTPHTPFQTPADRSTEMLVSASTSLAESDTHWHRATIDAWLADYAQRLGVNLESETRITQLQPRNPGWRIEANTRQKAWHLEVDFIIDASGPNSPLAEALNLNPTTDNLATRTGAVFAHFSNLPPFQSIYTAAGGNTQPHPYPLDQAAVHHITGKQWMWQLRFDHSVTSAGIVAPPELLPTNQHDLESWWQQWLDQYPSLKEQFSQAVHVDPPEGLRTIARMQFRRSQAAGADWLMLPSAYGFIDPLHSAGLAHSLWSIAQVADLFTDSAPNAPPADKLLAYSNSLQHELQLIDRLVAGCYLALPDFDLFTLYSMWYFACAIQTERSEDGKDTGFLGCKQPALMQAVKQAYQDIPRLKTDKPLTSSLRQQRRDQYRETLRPFNSVGLLDHQTHPLYQHTAAPAKTPIRDP